MPDKRPYSLAAVIGGLTLGFCAGCESSKVSDREWLFFPPPPAQPRIQFLTWANGADEVEPRRAKFEDFILGEEPSIARRINKPYGVAVRDGVVYVCDTKGLGISRLDFKNHVYSVFGRSGPGRLRKPLNIVIDPLGYKFVVDPVRKQVVIYDPQDRYVRAHSVPEPCHPVDVAIYEDELFVLDNDASCQIVILDRTNGEVLGAFGGPGGEPGQFKIPNSLCIGPEGYLYVSDTHNWRIQKLTREGKPVWVKGLPGYRLGQFGRPRGIRAGPDGILYVVDGATEIVQMFNKEGQVLMRFGGPGSAPGALILPAILDIDKTSIPYFQQYVHEDFKVESLLFVANQYGPHLISIFAFGKFPEGYDLGVIKATELPSIASDAGIMPLDDATTQPTTLPSEYETNPHQD